MGKPCSLRPQIAGQNGTPLATTANRRAREQARTMLLLWPARTRCSKPQTGRQGQGVLAQGLGVAPSPPGLCAYEQGGKLGAAEQRAASGSALAAGCDVTPPEHRPASTTLPPRLLLLPSPLSPAPTCFKDMTNKENRDMLELECSYYFSPLQIIF